MSKILESAILTYQHPETPLMELDRVAKQFENLTDLELEEELRSIESRTCSYSSDSVARYRMGVRLFNRIKELRSIK